MGTESETAPRRPAALVLGLILAAAARAEEPPAPGQRAGIEEIIVTAERRETSLQDTPIAITALTAEAIEQRDLKELRDLETQVPGLTMSENFNHAQMTMRGVGTDFNTVIGEPGVAVYVDGIYLGRPYMSLSNFYSLERIEVLRGPQGTLFGRNATGGLVHFVTKRPARELEAEAAAMVGAREALRGRAAVSGPLGDTLAARFTVVAERADGTIENLVDGEDLHARKVLGVRGGALWEPVPAFEFRVDADWQKDEQNGPAVLPLTETRGSLTGGRRSPDPRKTYNDVEPFTEGDFGGVTLNSRLDLGFAALEGIAGWRTSDLGARIDVDGTDAPFLDITRTTGATQYSAELHLASAEASRITWLTGAYFYTEEAFDLLLGPLERTPAFPEGTVVIHQELPEHETTSYAGFGQATADLFYDVSLTLGVRYTLDRKRILQTFVLDALGVPNAVVNCQDLVTRADWSAFTPKVGVEWRALEDTLLYASWSRGFKGGGINISACGNVFDPENVDAWEGGIKTQWFSDRLQTNVAGFFYDYADLQTPFSEGIQQIVSNASEAKVQGVELEARWIPADWLAASGAVSWLDAKYLDFVHDDPHDPNAGERNWKGFRLMRSPEWKTTLAVDAPFHITDFGTVVPRIEWTYTTEWYFNFTNVERQEAHSLWNANVTFADARERFSVGAFAKNLGDRLLYNSIIPNSAVDGTIAQVAPPRTWGIEAVIRF